MQLRICGKNCNDGEKKIDDKILKFLLCVIKKCAIFY